MTCLRRSRSQENRKNGKSDLSATFFLNWREVLMSVITWLLSSAVLRTKSTGSTLK
jgi:hypothetical protein